MVKFTNMKKITKNIKKKKIIKIRIKYFYIFEYTV